MIELNSLIKTVGEILFVITLSFETHFCQFQSDTTYTLYSAYHKISKHYPQIKFPNNKALASRLIYEQNLIYSKLLNNRSLHLDLIRSKENVVKPAIVLVHGGGWSSGNKSMLNSLGEILAIEGYIAILVEYRLSREAKYPAAIIDVISAYNWLIKNSERCLIDTSAISFIGMSAGAQIAGMAAVELSKSHNNIKSYINIDGVVDFTTPLALKWENRRGEESSLAKWLGGSYESAPSKWKEASLPQYIGCNSPKTLFINSSQSRFRAGIEDYKMKLDKFGIYYEQIIIPNTPHSFWLFEPWFSECTDTIINFLNKISINKY